LLVSMKKADRRIGSLVSASLLVALGCSDPKPDPKAPEAPPPGHGHGHEHGHEGHEGQAPPPPESEQLPPTDPVQEQGTHGQPQPVTYSEDEVEAFAEVQLALVSYQQELAEEAQQGADQSELQKRYERRGEQIVQESGMSLDRFNEMARRVQADPTLQRRVQEAIEEKTGG
jgi:hypothetical protein